ncbi:RNA polymerase sigma factor SigJ [Pelagibacterium halotolerans]|uniref:RNA polymerase sigma factor SigJ n=1 Tax=Pelagibacterium halotolerans TaxID=531813 RepID=UPI00384DD579
MREQPEATIEAHRPRLCGLAYRMLGAASEAEDVVQDAYMRWYAQPRGTVKNPAGFLTTAVTRLCLDRLRSARARREVYVGPWLPEPLLTEGEDDRSGAEAVQPPAEADLLMAETVSAALLTAMEQLSPLERAVYLLREVFDYSHTEVGEIVGRTETACRQVHARARRAMKAARPRFSVDPDEHRRLLDGFIDACRGGDLPGLVALLSEDVVAQSDGGGVVSAARRVIEGPDAVAKLYIGLTRQLSGATQVLVRTVNGRPAILIAEGGVLVSVIQITAEDGRISSIIAVLNPHKLAHLARALGFRTVEDRRAG